MRLSRHVVGLAINPFPSRLYRCFVRSCRVGRRRVPPYAERIFVRSGPYGKRQLSNEGVDGRMQRSYPLKW